MKMYFNFLIIISLLAISNCYDPLSSYMKENGYIIILPIKDNQYIGSIYNQPNYKDQAKIELKDVYTNKTERDAIMSSAEANVTLPNLDVSKKYSLSAGASFIKEISAELKNNGITHYTISASDVKEYSISEAKFLQIFKRYEEKFPSFSYKDKYLAYSLLSANKLSYTFYDKNDGKVDLSASNLFKQFVKGKLGNEWDFNNKSELTFSEKRFIGVKFVKIKTDKDGKIPGLDSIPNIDPQKQLPAKTSIQGGENTLAKISCTFHGAGCNQINPPFESIKSFIFNTKYMTSDELSGNKIFAIGLTPNFMDQCKNPDYSAWGRTYIVNDSLRFEFSSHKGLTNPGKLNESTLQVISLLPESNGHTFNTQRASQNSGSWGDAVCTVTQVVRE